MDLTVVCLDHNGQPDGNNNPTVATAYLHRRTVPGELWFSPALAASLLRGLHDLQTAGVTETDSRLRWRRGPRWTEATQATLRYCR